MGEAGVVELLGDGEQRDRDVLSGTFPPRGEAFERACQRVTHLVGTDSISGPRPLRMSSDLRMVTEVVGIHG